MFTIHYDYIMQPYMICISEREIVQDNILSIIISSMTPRI